MGVKSVATTQRHPPWKQAALTFSENVRICCLLISDPETCGVSNFQVAEAGCRCVIQSYQLDYSACLLDSISATADRWFSLSTRVQLSSPVLIAAPNALHACKTAASLKLIVEAEARRGRFGYTCCIRERKYRANRTSKWYAIEFDGYDVNSILLNVHVSKKSIC